MTSTNGHNTNEDAFAELRGLLLGPEQAQLASLEEKVEKSKLTAEAVGAVLPGAIKSSIKRDSQALSDSLFPIMGPAIRKAIYNTLRSMVQSLNQTLEQSFSVQGLKWRLEAIRTGRSFAEIVLLHSLLYRVEQVFLIHKETGLMLQHVEADSVTAQDADMVSGMLKAIQDFVQDSFSVQKSDILENLQVGELSVWIEQGPQALLACVIRGNAPKELGFTFESAIEAIHLEQGGELEAFEGDAAAFEASRPHLEACLQSQYEAKKEKSSPYLWVVTGAILLLLAVWIIFSFIENRRWDNYLTRLRAEHGIVITGAEKRGGKFYITGLRDPLAQDPLSILKESNLNPESVVSNWEPYQALQPEFILARSKTILEPPESVTMRFENGILYASGAAPDQWVSDARKMARVIPGVTQFQIENLLDVEAVKKQIESVSILFVLNTDTILPGQDDKLQNLIKEIQSLSNTKKGLRIEIRGHADSSGTEEMNQELSQKRADKILSFLNSKGLKGVEFTTVGLGTRDQMKMENLEAEKEQNRRVSLRVVF